MGLPSTTNGDAISRPLYGSAATPLCFRYMTPSPICADPLAPSGRPFFERVLLPHRSLPSRNFHLLMGLLGLISVAVGVGFVSVGAWPVIGFFGLDVALVYLAFRLNYRTPTRSTEKTSWASRIVSLCRAVR